MITTSTRRAARRAGALALALTAISTLPRAASAQFGGMQLNGTATIDAGGRLVLTQATGGHGSAFTVAPFSTASIRSLTATFNYFVGGGSGADGLAFVIQGNGPGALGNGGGGIGYDGIPNSEAALFRSFVYNVVQTGTNGVLGGPSASASIRGTHDATVAYDALAGTFMVTLDGGPTVTQTGVDLAAIVGPNAYFGFTASTGGATDEHRINGYQLSIVTNVAAVPEPGTWVLLATGLAGVAGFARRRRA